MFKINIGFTEGDWWRNGGPTKRWVSIYLEPEGSTILVEATGNLEDKTPTSFWFMEQMNCGKWEYVFLLAPRWYINKSPVLGEKTVEMSRSMFISESPSIRLNDILSFRKELIEKHETESL